MGSAPVGWFPLGPGEIYDPWYHGSRTYFTRINITNIRYSRHHHRGDVEHGLHRHYDRYRRGLPPPVRAEHYAHRDARSVTAVPGHHLPTRNRSVGTACTSMPNNCIERRF